MKTFAQYNDYLGKVSADKSDIVEISPLMDLSKKAGIDTDKYKPIGIEVFYGDTGKDYISIYVEDKEKKAKGEDTYILRVNNVDLSIADVVKKFKILKYNIMDKSHDENANVKDISLCDLDEL